MKSLFDTVSKECSKLTTQKYSTSFSLGILFLEKKLRDPIYSIYGFVRFADEIVDSFHDYDKKNMLQSFRKNTEEAIRDGISINPILNSFQSVVHDYKIKQEWIDAFFDSMEMDLHKKDYSFNEYAEYIVGSAEVVGLMCLHVFTEGDEAGFDQLKRYAMKLGSAFQKVNFLRDAKADNEEMGRTYFPDVDLKNFSSTDKMRIEKEIEEDFSEGLKGIKLLPQSSKNGVYLAYYYYRVLFNKIKKMPPQKILDGRVRIHNVHKLVLMCKSNLRYQLNLL